MESQRKFNDYFIASTASCTNGVLQGKQRKEWYKTYDTDLKTLDNYKYIPDENTKRITSSCTYIQQV